MFLAIDAGNTNIVFAVFRGSKILCQWRLQTHSRMSVALFKRNIRAALKNFSVPLSSFDGGILASVVPALNRPLKSAFRALTDKALLVVGEKGVTADINNKLLKPKEAGSDRLLNAFAGRQFYGAPLIVVDFGTATTLDVVGHDGSYLGGAICPGPNLSARALHLFTAQLPQISVTPINKALGQDTLHAMRSGLFFGHLGAIEGLVARLRKELGGRVKTVATGGLATLFVRRTKAIDLFRADLTLQGLRLVYEQHK